MESMKVEVESALEKIREGLMVGSKVQVEMKGSPRYVLEGMLSSVDEYLNLHLLETVELVGGEKTRSLGSVILRGNNIILISPVE